MACVVALRTTRRSWQRREMLENKNRYTFFSPRHWSVYEFRQFRPFRVTFAICINVYGIAQNFRLESTVRQLESFRVRRVWGTHLHKEYRLIDKRMQACVFIDVLHRKDKHPAEEKERKVNGP